MSKQTCSKFVAQYPINFLSGDIEQIEKIVKSILDTKGIRINHIEECLNSGSSVYIAFHVSGLNYEYRDKKGTVTKPITIITAHFRREKGFSSYELLKELESQGKKDIDHADFIGYDITFWTDSSYRLYRHKNWIQLEGKNHFIYNDNIYSQEFRTDIESYLINLIAMKGK